MEYDNGKENTIQLLGITGIIASLACVIQHLFLVEYAFRWMPIVLVIIDAFLFASFILFYKMKSISATFLLISGIMMLLQQAFFLAAGGILWLCVLVTAFTIVVVVLCYIQELKLYMKQLELEEKNDLYNY
jgi:hypothetical protein